MKTIEKIKIKLIDRIKTTEDEQLLTALDSIFVSNLNSKKLILSEEQIKMLEMSEHDIENDDLISAEELKKLDSEWMN